MKWRKKHTGLLLMFLSILTFAVLYATHLTVVNRLLVIPLILLLGGLLLYIWGKKRESPY